MTLGEMLRQERMGAGIADQKNLDAQYARAVMGDGKFEVGHGVCTQINSWVTWCLYSERLGLYR